MMAVLFGMLLNSRSPRMAARITWMADDSPAARKKCRTSTAAVGWLMTLP
jgi:hypothetical protein